MKSGSYIIKSIFDKVIGIILFALIFPVIAAVSMIIIFVDGSPIIFSHKRIGKNNRVFKFYKFRTMKNANASNNAMFNEEERITRLGRFLRRTSLDELPSLFNLLKGDISLVGPRPLLEKYLPRYNSFQARRHEVKPGITGLAQVKGRNLLSWEDKFEYDVYYVDNHSLLLDLKIIFLTVGEVLKRSGVSPDGAEIMPEFLGNKKRQA